MPAGRVTQGVCERVLLRVLVARARVIGWKMQRTTTFSLIPVCRHVSLMEIQFIKVAIFQVQKVEILTFRILTHGVEAAQACLTHRSSTHATALTRMGSVGFT
jgi:hypothetical protein